MDAFDSIPDPVVIDILNKVGDVKTLIRCRSVSKRFNSLSTQSDSLLLQLDQILGTTTVTDSDSEIEDSPISNFFRSIFKSIHCLLPIFSKPIDPSQILTRSPKTPAQILSRFERIRNLEVELYGGDVKLEKGAAVKWKAEFGETLKSCVIVAYRSATVNPTESIVVDGGGVESDSEFVCGLKTRVVWTISALMAASTRHYLMKDLVKDHKEMEKLTVYDRDGEGTVVMNGAGMKEYRETAAREIEKGVERVVVRERTVVPSVRMSMRHAPSLKLKSGIVLEAATLVVVRPSGVVVSDDDDVEIATEAFAGDGGDCMYGEAVTALLKRRRNVLEMNSF